MQPWHPDALFDLETFAHAEIFYDVTYVWEALSKIEAYLKKLGPYKIRGQISPRAHLVNPESVSIGRGTIVEPGAYIRGPCFIGDHCTVRQGAYIRGNLITGDRVVIGHDTEVKNSIFLNHAQAAHFAYVGDSILGSHVNLGAGTKCANLKLDESPIALIWENLRLDTKLRKFGAILADGVQTGCNSVTNPGTIMGKKSLCYPCVNVGGIIPPGHVVKNSFVPSISAWEGSRRPH